MQTDRATIPIRQRGAEGPYFRADIQGLRALAVLFVVLYHARAPFFSGGYVGVDVFFVISGYLITGLLVREVEEKGGIDFFAFYARRMRRLLPAAAVVLVATAMMVWLWLSPLEQKQLAPSVFVSALYISNFWFASKATDYLAGNFHNNPLLHTWSLAVEEQFYLVWPLLVFLGARVGSRAGLRGRLMVTIAVVCALSLGGALWVMCIAQPWAFFGSPLRAWEFAAGGLAFLATRHVTGWADRVKDGLVALGLVITLTTVVLYDTKTRFPGAAALVPVVGTVLMTVAGGGRGLMTRWLGTPVMQTVGNLSYSWYLWHWPILALLPIHSLSLSERLAWVFVSFLLAWGTYVVIENRVRFSPWLVASPFRSIALGLCLTCAGTGSALGLRSMAAAAMTSPGQAEYMRAHADWPRVFQENCHQSYFKEDVHECTYGDRTAHRTMVLLGDSHAAQWFPALERIAYDQRWQLLSLTKADCPAAQIIPYNRDLHRTYEECLRWRDVVMRRIAAERPALVVIANATRKYIRHPAFQIDAAAWGEGLHRMLVDLRRAGARVAVLRDTPFPNFDIPTCLSRAAWRGKDIIAACSFERGLALNAQIFEIEQRVTKDLEHVLVIDLSDLLCPGLRCQPLRGEMVAYRDGDHPTTWASASLAPALLERLSALVPE